MNKETPFIRHVNRIFRQRSSPVPIQPRPVVPNYNSERERLQTFDSYWSVSYIDHHVLAATGMYCLRTRDAVKCHFCDLTISNWQERDDPVEEHLKYSPTCPLLRRQRTSNIPLRCSSLDRLIPQSTPDECGCVRLPYCENSPLQTILAFPFYAHEEARIKSYTEWPKVMQNKIPRFVEAGFFYTGRGDQVQCFSCGVLGKEWEEGDDPWVKHAIAQPCCKFLNLIRGREFIEESIIRYKEQEREASKSLKVGSNPYDRQISVASSFGGSEVDSSNSCKLCYLEERNAVFLPCGHVVACAKCASSVDKCPVCREPFNDIIRLYFS